VVSKTKESCDWYSIEMQAEVDPHKEVEEREQEDERELVRAAISKLNDNRRSSMLVSSFALRPDI
jgi:hypothetical protein